MGQGNGLGSLIQKDEEGDWISSASPSSDSHQPAWTVFR